MRKILILFAVCFSTFYLAQDSLGLKLYRENVGNSYFIYADNNEFAPISLEYNYTANNMSSSLEDKIVKVIPPNTKKFLLTELKSLDPKKETHFDYNVFYVLGNVNVNFSESDIVYSLPFAKNKKYKIYQGYNGNFSHQNAYSLDFSLLNGDQVYASRSGKVVEVVTKNNQNCITENCAKFNNKIIILHSDGTFAEYVHLKQNGSVVKVGEEISEGQLIGFSGNTGWSEGPHLHFSVFVNKINGQRHYIKTKFKTSNSTPEYLLEKKSYLKNY